MKKKITTTLLIILTSTSLISCKNSATSVDNYDYKENLAAGYKELSNRRYKDLKVGEGMRFSSRSKILENPDVYDVDGVDANELTKSMEDDAIQADMILNLIKMHGGREFFPKATASLQLSYDCWVSGIKLKPISKDAKMCKRHFNHTSQELFDLLSEIEMNNSSIIRGDVVFPISKASLGENEKKLLERLLIKLNEGGIKKIILEAHSDTSGTRKYNQWISDKRGEVVKNWLVKKGINKDKIVVRSHADDMPLFESGPHKTDERNRAVSIIAIK